jgi:hypothetical protein
MPLCTPNATSHAIGVFPGLLLQPIAWGDLGLRGMQSFISRFLSQLSADRTDSLSTIAMTASPETPTKPVDSPDVTVEESKLENGQDAVQEGAYASMAIDHKAERRLCLKFDLHILPVLAIMCE